MSVPTGGSLQDAAAQLAGGVDPAQILHELLSAGDNRPDASVGAGSAPGLADAQAGGLPNGAPANGGLPDVTKRAPDDAGLLGQPQTQNGPYQGASPNPYEIVQHATGADATGYNTPGQPVTPDDILRHALGLDKTAYAPDGVSPPAQLPNGLTGSAPPAGASPAPSGAASGGALPAKNTFDFYQGDYTPGKGVADKDGYFDPTYHSEANIINNARNGDDAAYAKLEVMAKGGNAEAKSVLQDLGTADAFMHSAVHNDWIPGHDKAIDTELAQGMYAKNAEARANLGLQREVPVKGLETVAQSNPQAAEMMLSLAQLNPGAKPSFDSRGVVWTASDGTERSVPIGQIADANAKLQETLRGLSGTAEEQAAADAAGKKSKVK